MYRQTNILCGSRASSRPAVRLTASRRGETIPKPVLDSRSLELQSLIPQSYIMRALTNILIVPLLTSAVVTTWRP